MAVADQRTRAVVRPSNIRISGGLAFRAVADKSEPTRSAVPIIYGSIWEVSETCTT
jgi:hypothetical protein